jgi:hypothetical protein
MHGQFILCGRTVPSQVRLTKLWSHRQLLVGHRFPTSLPRPQASRYRSTTRWELVLRGRVRTRPDFLRSCGSAPDSRRGPGASCGEVHQCEEEIMVDSNMPTLRSKSTNLTIGRAMARCRPSTTSSTSATTSSAAARSAGRPHHQQGGGAGVASGRDVRPRAAGGRGMQPWQAGQQADLGNALPKT